MIIYIIVKIMLSYWLIIRKQWIKDSKKLNIGIDIVVIIIFIYLIIKSQIKIEETLWVLEIGSMMMMVYLTYKFLEYINKRVEEILLWVEKKEKIKKILLKPIINKTIYYLTWMLPWNINYWIYFWIMENSWYLRVWFSSNRDIFFWKYFRWDSRDFFFKWNERIEEIGYRWIKENIIAEIYRVILRILVIIYIIRKKILEMKIREYIWIRMVIYMYLSIFYLSLIFYFHIINAYLFWIFMVIEVIMLILAGRIINYCLIKYDKEIIILIEKKIITTEFIEVLQLIKDPIYIDIRMKWEINIYIWDKTLSNAITLNILYKYMIWVNKNTKGYYDKQMNIRSRIHRMKMLEEKSIIWDVLPRTRYVITSLKNFGYVHHTYMNQDIDLSEEHKFTNLCKNKNFYLSYYEKAYSKTSLTMLVWLLRTNLKYWGAWEVRQIGIFSEFFKKIHDTYKDKILSELTVYEEVILYYYTFDKRFFGNDIKEKNNILFSIFFGSWDICYFEEFYIHYYKKNIIENKKKLEIPKKFVSISGYKQMFKIMGRIQLSEEEAIVWNENLQKLLEQKKAYLDNCEKSEIEYDPQLSVFFDKSYYVFLTRKFLDSGAGNTEESLERAIIRLKKLIKTKVAIEEILRWYYFRHEELYGGQEFDLEKIKKMIETDLVEETQWDIYERLQTDTDMLTGLHIRMILQHIRYTNLGGVKGLNGDYTEEIEKYNRK